MASTGASSPVQASNCTMACASSISRPSMIVQPAACASRRNRVASGSYTMSKTIVPGRCIRAGTGVSSGFEAEPTGVALMSTSQGYVPRSFSAPCAQPAACAASPALTRSRPRMVTRAPLRRSARAAARAAPPAPTTTTDLPFTSVRLRNGMRTPAPSVVEPCSDPFLTTTVLTLPQTAEASSTASRWSMMPTLYGRVTLKPARSSVGSACTNGSSASACSGTYTASSDRASNARLWRTGERLRATSEPSTP
jgi:hypothetical protein